MFSRSAAAPKCSSSATAMNDSSWISGKIDSLLEDCLSIVAWTCIDAAF